MSDDPLNPYRAKIDAVDDTLLRLLNERAALAREIGRLKNGSAYRPEREAQILRRMREQNPGPLSPEAISKVFREIISACLALEKSLSVAYLGPPGTFSESAAVAHFGHAAELRDCASIDEVFREVEATASDYGLVPVENSSGGAVGRTLDLTAQTPLKICGEVMLRVHHHVMTRAEALADVKKIYSHAQSFAQCHEWLNRNLPGVPRIPVESNALAASMAANEAGAAAIAGEAAAERYRLPILARNIEDEPENTTRFWVIGQHDAGRSGVDKTSVVMGAANRPGAMYELLEPLSKYGVSMSRLESRPSRAALWEYLFFVDIEGHREDDAVAAALSELAGKAAFLKILGSYPCAMN